VTHTVGRILAIALATLAVAGVVQAQKTYKWMDPQGSIRYSDQPPPPGARVLRETGDAPAPAAEAEKPPVTLYVAPRCDACDLVGHWLRQRNVPYNEVNAAADAEAQALLTRRYGQVGVPVLAVGEALTLGYNPIDFERVLNGAGYAVAGPETAAVAGAAEQKREPEAAQ
jgi:glutaredoxin